MRLPPLSAVLATLLCLGCHAEVRDGVHDEPDGLSGKMAADLVVPLLRIEDEYAAWGRVDDNVRWAPTACRLDPGAGRVSRSTGAHGGKLYYLYARDRAAYVDPERGAAPVGQTIVKEAFEPVALAPGEGDDGFGRDAAGRPLAERDGVRYRAGRPAGLFVLHKTGGDPAETDEGWVYATLSGTGDERRILASGRLAECMACHARGTVDRQFGLAAR